MIIYFYCLCKSRDKLRAKELKNTYSAEIRTTRDNPVYAKEASGYGMRLPIIVQDGKARQLYAE